MAYRRTRSRTQPPVIPLSSHLQPKAFLVWMKQVVPLYRQLSSNILREVCLYIGARPLLAHTKRSELILFDLQTLHGSVRTHSDIGLAEQYKHRATCVCIGDDQVFLCGGVSKYNGTWCVMPTAVAICCSRAVHLNMMRIPRVDHGLFYDEASRHAFVFGGWTCYGALEACEQYDFTCNAWSPLHHMNYARFGVDVCGYQGKVYLSGHSRLEVFTIAARKFDKLPLELGDSYRCLPVVWESQLIVVDENKVRRWDMSTYTFLGETTVNLLNSPRVAFVARDALFVLQKRQCISTALAEMKTFSVYTF